MGRREGEVKLKTRRRDLRAGRSMRASAFTLIELALVAFIILVLVGLSAPLFKRTFSNLTVKESAFNIAKMIGYAQEKAILSRKNFKIKFDFENSKYQLLERDDTAVDGTGYNKAGGRFGRVLALPRGISLSGSGNEMTFNPDGSCDDMTVDVRDARGNGYRISSRGFGSLPEVKEIAYE